MSTVLFFEFRRKRKKLLGYVMAPVILSLILFVLCVAVDFLFPGFNKTYMRWPDLVKDFLCLKPWSGDLWLNVWQFFALLYPFYLTYSMMSGMAEALSEEERLETVVYLHNAGIDRKTIFASKLLVWTGETFACCFSLLLLHEILAAVLQQQQGMRNVLAYYIILFLVCLLYLSMALFMSVCRAEKGVSADMVTGLLILPWLFSRVPALLRFLSELLVLTGREGAVIGQMGEIGERTEVFTILSPLTWSWPALNVPGSYIVCGTIVFFVLSGTAFSIYTHKKRV